MGERARKNDEETKKKISLILVSSADLCIDLTFIYFTAHVICEFPSWFDLIAKMQTKKNPKMMDFFFSFFFFGTLTHNNLVLFLFLQMITAPGWIYCILTLFSDSLF